MSEPRPAGESVASGVRVGSTAGLCVTSRSLEPTLGENWRIRELSGVASTGDRTEPASGEGLTVGDGLGDGVGIVRCISRRWPAMRSNRDCRPIVLCSEMLGDGRSLNALRLSGLIALSLLEGVCLNAGGENDGRDGLIVGDLSGVGDGAERKDGAGALGATEVLG